MAKSAAKAKEEKETKPVQHKSSESGHHFNPTLVRGMGALLMFLGLMLCVMLNSMTGLFVKVAALFALVLGFYLTVSGIRVLASKTNGSDARNKGAIWLVVGILLIAAGVLALLYEGNIATWVLVVVGALIAVFGLVMLIMLAVAQRGRKKVVLDVICSVATMMVGVLVALLVLPAVGNSLHHLCYYLFGGLAIALGGVELIMY